MRLLFYVSKLYSIPVVTPVFNEGTGRGIPCAMYVSKKVKKSLPGELSKHPVFTELREAIDYQPDFVLCPGNFVDFRIPGRKVELFHGIGVEKPSHYRIRHFFDYYFTSGPLVTERFREMEEKYGYFRTYETGWPKMDHIHNYNPGDIRKSLQIPENMKVVLYAPTHSSGMESSSEIIHVMDNLVRADEIWFCKPHEFMDRNQLDRLSKTKARIIEHYDITPYLHLSDVLIGDTSSVIYEFMSLDKPVVTFRTAERRDKGIDVRSTAELREALDRSLAFPGEFTENRMRNIMEVNPILDGSISRGIIDLLLSIDPTDSPGRKKKPLNLFRKMQIIYHSRFRKGYLR